MFLQLSSCLASFSPPPSALLPFAGSHLCFMLLASVFCVTGEGPHLTILQETMRRIGCLSVFIHLHSRRFSYFFFMRPTDNSIPMSFD